MTSKAAFSVRFASVERRGIRIYNGPVIAAGAESPVETRRILIILPSWVGDLVLATPALEAIRARFPSAHIIGLLKPGLSDVVSGSPWFDEELYWDEPAGKATGKSGLFRLAGRLRREPIDLAVAFPNSFRSALIGFLSGARRRYGYARQGRTLLLTDRLRAPRAAGRFKPSPVLDYYNRLAEQVGRNALRSCPHSIRQRKKNRAWISFSYVPRFPGVRRSWC